MRKLIAMSERGCLVTNTLKDAVAISVTSRNRHEATADEPAASYAQRVEGGAAGH